MNEGFLRLEGVEKSYGINNVVKHIDLSVGQGEFMSFLGPSGCGKTTTLRMIAGFERPSAGRLFAGEIELTNLRPADRHVGMVFQSYALFPNLTIADNIGFGLKVSGASKEKIRERVTDMLATIGLPGFEKRFPYQLSGGQQQRVALARALAAQPQMLLLDEPLSALDAKIRVSLREEIRAIQRQMGITTIYVTHDQEEALSMSDRIVVMNEGRIEQVGTPFEIYNQPATRFVANFVGTLNLLETVLENVANKTVRIGQRSVQVKSVPNGLKSGAKVSMAFRPEAVRLGNANGHDIVLDGRVDEVSFLGSIVRLKVALGESLVKLDIFNDPRTPPPSRGSNVTLSMASAALFPLIA